MFEYRRTQDALMAKHMEHGLCYNCDKKIHRSKDSPNRKPKLASEDDKSNQVCCVYMYMLVYVNAKCKLTLVKDRC